LYRGIFFHGIKTMMGNQQIDGIMMEKMKRREKGYEKDGEYE